MADRGGGGAELEKLEEEIRERRGGGKGRTKGWEQDPMRG